MIQQRTRARARSGLRMHLSQNRTRVRMRSRSTKSRHRFTGGAFAAINGLYDSVSIPLKVADAKRAGQDLIHNVNQIHKFYAYCASMNVSTIECPSLRKRFTDAVAELGKYIDFIIRSTIPIKCVAYAQGRTFGGNDNVLKDIEDINKLIIKTGVSPPSFLSKLSGMIGTLTDIGMITMFADWYRYELYILATNLNTIVSEILHSNITLQCAISRDLLDKTGKLIAASSSSAASSSKSATTASATAYRRSAMSSSATSAAPQRFKRGDFKVLTLLDDK